MKISVITPFYYGNEYLHDYQEMMDANEQVLKERYGTEHSMEIILVNDSPECAMKLQGIYNGRPNWKTVKNRCNMGIHASRLEGLKAAVGDHIIFLDQDDRIADDAIAMFAEAASDKPYNVIVANAVIESGNGPELWYRTNYHKKLIGDIKTYLTVGTQIISPGQCMIPTMVIPDYWRKNICRINGADDYYLWLLLLQNGIDFTYLDAPLYTHKRTGKNLSGDTRLTDQSSYEFIKMLEENPEFPKERLYELKRMIVYKAEFRQSGFFGKVRLSIQNLGIFMANIYFKLRTATPYGFNR
ncbi:MAG: glycosyltransferase family 2 protein [Lachnospiraceae bacterium]|nr:glycosyltransferase family 2 protein [Lachnospiraceae bacterium]